MRIGRREAGLHFKHELILAFLFQCLRHLADRLCKVNAHFLLIRVFCSFQSTNPTVLGLRCSVSPWLAPGSASLSLKPPLETPPRGHFTATLQDQRSCFAACQGQSCVLSHQIPTSPLQGVIAHLCQVRRLRLTEVKALRAHTNFTKEQIAFLRKSFFLSKNKCK